MARDVARSVAHANGFAWNDATVEIVLDTQLAPVTCRRVVLWPDTPVATDFMDQFIDVVTSLPPDILIDASTGVLIGLKPLRESLVRVENFGKRFRSI